MGEEQKIEITKEEFKTKFSELEQLREQLRINKINFDEIYDEFVKIKEKEFSYKKTIRLFGIPIIKIENKNLFSEN
jgi:hypothetical protein